MLIIFKEMRMAAMPTDPDSPDSYADHSQNLITGSLSHLGDFLKISSKSIHNLLSYLCLKITFHGAEDPESGPNHSQNLIISSFSDISLKFHQNPSISF